MNLSKPQVSCVSIHYKNPEIITRGREPGEPNKYFQERPFSCPNCGKEKAWILVLHKFTDDLVVWQCENCKYNAGVVK